MNTKTSHSSIVVLKGITGEAGLTENHKEKVFIISVSLAKIFTMKGMSQGNPMELGS